AVAGRGYVRAAGRGTPPPDSCAAGMTRTIGPASIGVAPPANDVRGPVRMHVLDLQAFRSTPLGREPFDYLIVPRLGRPEARAAISADYPRIADPGSFPLEQLSYGPAFGSLIDALRGSDMRDAFATKFDLDLRDRPTTVTVRGQCGTRDGNIHTDSASKLITVLIYMNGAWESDGGRLRLLRS